MTLRILAYSLQDHFRVLQFNQYFKRNEEETYSLTLLLGMGPSKTPRPARVFHGFPVLQEEIFRSMNVKGLLPFIFCTCPWKCIWHKEQMFLWPLSLNTLTLSIWHAVLPVFIDEWALRNAKVRRWLHRSSERRERSMHPRKKYASQKNRFLSHPFPWRMEFPEKERRVPHSQGKASAQFSTSPTLYSYAGERVEMVCEMKRPTLLRLN